MNLVSQQYTVGSDCTEVQAGLALYCWQRLINSVHAGYGLIKYYLLLFKHFLYKSRLTKFTILHQTVVNTVPPRISYWSYIKFYGIYCEQSRRRSEAISSIKLDIDQLLAYSLSRSHVGNVIWSLNPYPANTESD